MTTALNGTSPTTAIVYACEPDAASSIAAADDLVRVVHTQGMRVRAVVADVAPRGSSLAERRGWATVSPLLKSCGTLVVRSRTDLECHAGDDRTQVLRRLGARRVEAIRPAPWETKDWLRKWAGPKLAAKHAEEPAGGLSPGMCCVVFPALGVHVGDARRLARRFFEPWQEPLGEDWDLLVVTVSELVTNAVVHGSRPGDLVTLILQHSPQALRVAVDDAGTGKPRLRVPGAAQVGGQGMRLVDNLTNDWGSTRFSNRPGKRVWMNVHPRGAPTLATAS